MEFETPVDAWYVWLGVALTSLAIVGVALSLPSQPPPDATAAANTIDTVAGSTHTAAGSYEHTADELRLDRGRISLRNEAGTTHATVVFETLTPVSAVSNSTLRAVLDRIVHQTQPENALAELGVESLEERDLWQAVDRAQRQTRRPEWRPTTGPLRVRQVTLDGNTAVLIKI